MLTENPSFTNQFTEKLTILQTRTINKYGMKKFELMTLPYADDALEPVISKETIGFHHGKHLLAYVKHELFLITSF